MEIEIKKLLKQYEGDKTAIIRCLQDVTKQFGYVPREAIKVICEVTTAPESEIYGVLTFYSQFSLTPKAKYNIEVCMGTACFVLGNGTILDVLSSNLKIGLGEITPDGKFSIAQSRCLGCCGFAPVMAINGKIYGKLTVDKIGEILAGCE